MELRPLIKEACNIIRARIKERKEFPLIIIEAPTAYGKTTSSPALYAPLRKAGLASSYIHVLPLRALVKETVESATTGTVANTLMNSLGISNLREAIGYQAMALSIEGKSPYFIKEIVYTTLHSFIFNTFRLPVAEAGQSSRHFELPRAYILNSLTVFDEAHLYGGNTPFRIGLEFLLRHGVPVIIETATLPEASVKILGNIAYGQDIECMRIGLQNAFETGYCSFLKVNDELFFRMHCSTVWETKVVRVNGIDELVEKTARNIADVVRKNRRVLVVMNTPEQAVLVKRQLSRNGISCEMIHGRMVIKDREKALNAIESGRVKVLIGTQVVEAGINIGFDAVITASALPSSLIQRIGRAARQGEEKAEAIIIHDESGKGLGPYQDRKEDIDDVVRYIEEIINNHGSQAISWRCPQEYDGAPHKVTFVEILKYEPPLREENVLESALVRLASSPVVGTNYINMIFEESFCDMFGEGALILPLQVQSRGELPLGPKTLASLLKHGINVMACKDGYCEPLHSFGVKQRLSTKGWCRFVREVLSKGLELRVSHSEYREGEGLVWV